MSECVGVLVPDQDQPPTTYAPVNPFKAPPVATILGGKLLSGSKPKRSKRNFRPKASDVGRINSRVKTGA